MLREQFEWFMCDRTIVCVLCIVGRDSGVFFDCDVACVMSLLMLFIFNILIMIIHVFEISLCFDSVTLLHAFISLRLFTLDLYLCCIISCFPQIPFIFVKRCTSQTQSHSSGLNGLSANSNFGGASFFRPMKMTIYTFGILGLVHTHKKSGLIFVRFMTIIWRMIYTKT